MNTPTPLLARVAPKAGLVLRFFAGLALGVLGHYLLYRMSLPVEPFIYAAF
jgi:hypothetical protein